MPAVYRSASRQANKQAPPRSINPLMVVTAVLALAVFVFFLYRWTFGSPRLTAEKQKERAQALQAIQKIPFPGEPGNTDGSTPLSIPGGRR